MSFGTFWSFSMQSFRSLRFHEPFVCCICRILFNFSFICVMLTAPGGWGGVCVLIWMMVLCCLSVLKMKYCSQEGTVNRVQAKRTGERRKREKTENPWKASSAYPSEVVSGL